MLKGSHDFAFGKFSGERSFPRRRQVEPRTNGNQQGDASREGKILLVRYAQP
jgi:hypothetical protein